MHDAQPAARQRMVRDQLRARGIVDERALAAFIDVPREAFVAEEIRDHAYDDCPLPLEYGQTISQPLIVAMSVQALEIRPTDRVLEIGTGSGYAAAILSRMAKEVHTVERIPSLAQSAKVRLRTLGFRDVHVHSGDGSLGWAEAAPYDAICVSAGGPHIPKALREQLAVGGRLVIPVGPISENQMLTRVVRDGADAFREMPMTWVRFVPLIGEEGHAQTG